MTRKESWLKRSLLKLVWHLWAWWKVHRWSCWDLLYMCIQSVSVIKNEEYLKASIWIAIKWVPYNSSITHLICSKPRSCKIHFILFYNFMWNSFLIDKDSIDSTICFRRCLKALQPPMANCFSLNWKSEMGPVSPIPKCEIMKVGEDSRFHKGCWSKHCFWL